MGPMKDKTIEKGRRFIYIYENGLRVYNIRK
jgi:hypothetical protein